MGSTKRSAGFALSTFSTESYEMAKIGHPQGFTLIELLVVIAIIALLLSIVMPSLNMVRKKARGLICRTNIKSMQLATLIYVEENDDKTMSYETTPVYTLWLRQIAPYVGDIDEVRYCPIGKVMEDSNRSFGDGWGTATEAWRWQKSGMNEPEHGSYAMNGWFYYRNNDPDTRAFGKVSRVKTSSLTPLFGDGAYVDSWPQDSDTVTNDFSLNICRPDTGRMNRYLMNRHGSYVNIGFMDGHQEPVGLEMLWSLKWNAEFKMKGAMTRQNGSPIYQK